MWYVEVTTSDNYTPKPNHTFFGKTSFLMEYLHKTRLEAIKDIKCYKEPKEGIEYYDVDNDKHMRRY